MALDQFFNPVSDTRRALRLAVVDSQDKLAQQFTPSTTADISQVDLQLSKSGIPSGNIWVEIWSDSSDLPNAQIGTDSSTVTCASVTSTSIPGETKTFTFSAGITLTASTKYWIVIDADYTKSDTDWMGFCYLAAGGYTGGIVAKFTPWATDGSHDYWFNEYYVEATTTSTTTTTSTSTTTTSTSTSTTSTSSSTSSSTSTTTTIAPEAYTNYQGIFNGTTSRGTISDTLVLRPDTNNAFSVAMWIDPDDYANNVLPRLWAKGTHYTAIMGDTTNGRYGNVALEVQNTLGNATEYWGGTQLKVGRRYHIVVTFDGSLGGDTQTKIYLNGVAETVTRLANAWTGTLKVTTSGNTGVVIGNSHAFDRGFDGRIDEVLFYQRVLTATEALDLYTSQTIPTSPDLKLLFDDQADPTQDSSGNGNHLDLTNVTFEAVEYGIEVDGSNDGLTVASYAPPTASAFSFSVWVYKDGNQDANDRIIDWQDGGPANGWTLIVDGGDTTKIGFRGNNGAAQTWSILTNASVANGEWHHFVGTWTPTSTKFYLDSVQQGATDVSSALSAATATFSVGKRAGGSNFFKGRVDRLRIYNRVLSQNDIDQLFALQYADLGINLNLLFDSYLEDTSGNNFDATAVDKPLFVRAGPTEAEVTTTSTSTTTTSTSTTTTSTSTTSTSSSTSTSSTTSTSTSTSSSTSSSSSTSTSTTYPFYTMEIDDLWQDE